MKKTKPNSPETTPCADAGFLQRYLREELGEAEEARVQEHVSTCRDCQTALESAAGDAELWQGLSEGIETARLDEVDDLAPEQSLSAIAEYLAPTDDPAMLGRLGHYEIRGLIGQGSTGIVLKAFDPRLNRYVAIKLMSPAYRSSGAAQRRFEREGRAVAAVSHDHVVPVYAVDEYRGLPYIVMKYIPGLSLQQRIDRDGPMDSCGAARVGLQVASALAAAHAQGIVHRDVKPANVILEDTVDRAMVTDFGLARVADEVSMTHSGTITGTPQYMSPEQARGDSIDTRSDLFSLGSLLYTVCTGHPPFRAQTLFGVIHRVSESEPRAIREINPGIDEWLAALISVLMSKRVDERFQSAADVASALAAELAYLQNPTVAEKPRRAWFVPAAEAVGRRPGRLGLALVAAAAGGLFAGGFAFFTSQGSGDGGGGEHLASMAPDLGGAGGASKAALAGVLGVAQDPDGSTVDRVLRHSFPVEGDGRLTMHVEVGDVVIEPSDRSVIEIEVTRTVLADTEAEADQLVRAHLFRITPESGVCRILSSMQDEPTGAADRFRGVMHRLRVPSTCQVDVSTDQGSVVVGELSGRVEARSRHGNVVIGRVDGQVVAETHGGDIDLTRGCTGEAELKAIRGNIRVGDVQTDASVFTSGGDIHLSGSPGKVYAQTSGGSIFVDGVQGATGGFASGGNVVVRVPESPPENCRFSASHGEVVLEVAEDVRASIEARGDIESDHAFEPGSIEDETGRWFGMKLNGGGVRIRAESSGRVAIRTLGEVVVGQGGLGTSGGVSVAASGTRGSSTGVGSGASVSVAGSATSGGASVNPTGGAGSAVSVGGGSSRSGSSASGVGGSANGLGGSGASVGVGGSASSLGGSGASVGVGGSANGLGGSGASVGVGGSASSLGGSGSSVGVGGSANGLGGSGASVGVGGSASSLGGSGSSVGVGGSASSGGRGVAVSGGARARMAGAPRPGALATVPLDSESGMDGYTIYLPVSHETAEGPFPVLVYLQGAFGVGGDISAVNHWGLTRLLRDETDLGSERNRYLLDTFIVVSPHIVEGNYHDHPTVVRGILDDVFATYKADPDRVYMTGLSRGGHGTWGLAARLPGTFAAIVPIGGNSSGMDGDWDALSGVSVWVSHNRNDGVVSFENASDAIEAIEDRLGVEFRRFDRLIVRDTDFLDHRFILTSEVTDSHDAWTDVYSNAEFYRWLLRQRRGARVPAGSSSSPLIR